MGTGTRRVNVKLADDKPQITDAWTSLEIKPDFNDYVAHKGCLYGFDHNIFTCIDLETGKRNWKKGRYGNGQVLLLPDADQLLVLSEKGEIVVVRANPKDSEELAQEGAQRQDLEPSGAGGQPALHPQRRRGRLPGTAAGRIARRRRKRRGLRKKLREDRMRVWILVVGLAVGNLQPLDMSPIPVGPSAPQKPMAPVMLGRQRRAPHVFQWDGRPAPPTRRVPTR